MRTEGGLGSHLSAEEEAMVRMSKRVEPSSRMLTVSATDDPKLSHVSLQASMWDMRRLTTGRRTCCQYPLAANSLLITTGHPTGVSARLGNTYLPANPCASRLPEAWGLKRPPMNAQDEESRWWLSALLRGGNAPVGLAMALH